MIEYIKHPGDLVQDLVNDSELNGKNFARVVSHIRESVGAVPSVEGCKTVLVSTLSRGDTFVLKDFGDKNPFVYIVTDVSDWCVEVTSFSGKAFTFGKSVPVIPVKVSCAVKILEVK